jgi:transposase
VPRDTVTRRLAHEPLGWRPTTLLVTVRRYQCTGCGHVWRQDTSMAAEPRAKLSRRGLRWALEAIVVQHLTIARVAEGLGVAWNTANDAVLAEGKRVLIDDTARFDGVKVIGVDEHVWRDAVEVVAMDGFTGFKTATTEELPDAVTVMDPSTSSAWPATHSTAAGAASSKPPTDTADTRATRSTRPGGRCT